jgi:hypothetical protein
LFQIIFIVFRLIFEKNRGGSIKKISAIFGMAILIILIISNCGCFEDNNRNNGDMVIVEEDLSDYYFSLELELDENKYPDFIIITVTLTNLDETTIKLETYMINFPNIVITDPNGNDYNLFHGNISVTPDYKILNKNDKIQKKFNLTKYRYFGVSAHPVNIYFEAGFYTCQVFAYSLESNIINFEIN